MTPASRCGAPLPALTAPVLIVQISDGATTITITDGGQGDSDPVSGVVSFIGSDVFGNWNAVALSASGTQGPLDLQLQARFDTTLDRFGPSDSRSLRFRASMTEFDAGLVPSALTFFTTTSGSAAGGTGGGWDAYVDDLDTLLGTATAVGGSSLVGASSGSSTAELDGPYSATLQAYFNLESATALAVSGEQSVRLALPSHAVPTPGTVALVMAGLLLAARRRTGRPCAAASRQPRISGLRLPQQRPG